MIKINIKKEELENLIDSLESDFKKLKWSEIKKRSKTRTLSKKIDNEQKMNTK